MTKKTAAIVAGVLVAGLVIGFTAIAMASSDGSPSGKPSRTITVSSTATVKAAPDEAVVDLGVRSEAPDATAASAQNAKDMQAVLDALKAAKIDEKDIETLNVGLSQRVVDRGTPSEQRVFVASNSVRVTIHDLSAVGAVIDAGVQAGADSVNDLRFQLSDLNQIRTDALTQAVRGARTKADALAEAAGASVVRVVTIAEESFRTPTYPAPYAFGDAALAAAPTPVVPPDSLQVSVTISVVWEIA
ncbi:MAG: SIMPL domain-containing protein [Actinobacteria bacterium]|nr:SIMPL domain-containing protein [Actinomycetota bacterium]